MEKDPPNNAIYALLLSKAYSPRELGGFGGLGGTWRHLTGLEGTCVNLGNSGELGGTSGDLGELGGTRGNLGGQLGGLLL